ncbi:PaaI family thioesterase [Candidatus Bathyarchaeota archaeon]|nr:PaaI family thioesterase [Candidatus Bathyarchaeota archaeon]
MDTRTHKKANRALLGTPVSLGEGKAVVELVATEEMAVDDRGLVHGGFTFGLADYAAMLAVNDPLVVLGSADVRFTAPVKVGDKMTASAEVVDFEKRRRDVSVEVSVGDKKVLKGTLACFVLPKHVLDP